MRFMMFRSGFFFFYFHTPLADWTG